MTLYEFNALDELEQKEALWDKGVEIGRRKDATYSYVLYQIDGFYVEEKYHIEWEVMRGLRAFTTTKLLDPYLNDMDISTII